MSQQGLNVGCQPLVWSEDGYIKLCFHVDNYTKIKLAYKSSLCLLDPLNFNSFPTKSSVYTPPITDDELSQLVKLYK